MLLRHDLGCGLLRCFRLRTGLALVHHQVRFPVAGSHIILALTSGYVYHVRGLSDFEVCIWLFLGCCPFSKLLGFGLLLSPLLHLHHFLL